MKKSKNKIGLHKSWRDRAENPSQGRIILSGTEMWSSYLFGAQDLQTRVLEEVEKYQKDLIEPDNQLDNVIDIIKNIQA